MNKKKILSAAVAGGLLATSLLLPVNAAEIKPNNDKIAISVTKVTEALSGKGATHILSIVMPNEKVEGYNTLTRAKLDTLLKARYGEDITVTKVTDSKGTEIQADNTSAKVGTGSIVELSTGNKLAIVLYGDVTGDGIVDLYDTIAIAQNNVGSVKITDPISLKAGILAGSADKSETDIWDTIRVAGYNVGLAGTSGIYGDFIVDEPLFPEDKVESDTVLNEAIDEVNNNKLNDGKYEIALDTTKNEAEFKFLTADTEKISAFTESGLVETLVEKLKEYSEEIEKIELTFTMDKSVTVELTPSDDAGSCKLAAIQLLGGTSGSDLINKTINDLFGKTLTAKFYLRDTATLIPGETVTDENGKKSVTYSLNFVSGINTDSIITSVVDKVNKNEVNAKKFKIALDPETNTGTFGFVNNQNTMTNFIGSGTGLILQLAEALKDEKIEKIELSVTQGNGVVAVAAQAGDESASTVTLKKNASTQEIMTEAYKLMNYAFGITGDGAGHTQLLAKSVLDLAGAELTAKVYIKSGVEVSEGESVTSDASTQYVEYKLKFLVNADEELKLIFDDLNEHKGNDIYRIEFTPENGNVNFNIAQGHGSDKLSELLGQGKTGLVTATTGLLTNISGNNQLTSVTATFAGKTYNLRKGAEGQSSQVVELIKALLEKEDAITSSEEDSYTPNFGDTTLSVLSGKEVTIQFELTEKAAAESNWNQSQSLTVHFNLVNTTFEDNNN